MTFPTVPLPPAAGADATLIVLTSPECVYLLDLLDEGETEFADLAGRLRRRLGCDEGSARRYLALLVDAGFATPSTLDDDRWTGVGPSGMSDRLDHVVEVMRDLRFAGDIRQSDDLRLAMDAAWDGRSNKAVRRRRAVAFTMSPAGRRHQARLAAGSLGRPDAGPDGRPAAEPGAEPTSDASGPSGWSSS